MYNIAPSLSNDLFTKRSLRDRFRWFVSSARNFSKCSEQIDTGCVWVNLPFYYALATPLIKRGFFRDSRWKLIPFSESLAFCLNTQPQHLRWLFWSWCINLVERGPWERGCWCITAFRQMYAVTSCEAPKPSNMASKMADFLIVLVRSFLLLQSG